MHMHLKKIVAWWVIWCSLGASFLHATPKQLPQAFHPFYIGIGTGYGSSTWSGLMPSSQNQNIATNLSTPIKVNEGGAIWSILTGYEFTPYFALEGAYTRYPNAKVQFDSFSLYAFEHDDRVSFSTRTEMIALMGKVMLVIPNTKFRVYSSAGIADTHRKDEVTDRWRLGPTFGLGLNYRLTEHVMAELGGTYTAGYGEPELNPVEDYIPFLYAISFRLAYRI